jgi:RNA polymerase sigma factor (sigma-70 family)
MALGVEQIVRSPIGDVKKHGGFMALGPTHSAKVIGSTRGDEICQVPGKCEPPRTTPDECGTPSAESLLNIQSDITLSLLRTPESAWTTQHEDAARALTPMLIALARSVLCRFGMRTDYHTCCDAIQVWWELVLRDGGLTLKPHYGFGKYARVFMMRAVGRIADRRGSRQSCTKKNAEDLGGDTATTPQSVIQIPDRPQRRRVQPIQDAASICDNAPSPLEQAAQLQTAEQIRAEIARLKANLAEPIRCVFFDGLSVKQTAAKLGLTPNTVAMRLFYARRLLRQRLSRFRE